MSDEWKKNCPSCGSEQIYSVKRNYLTAVRLNKICLSCKSSGKNHPMFGKKQSEETKRKRSESLKGDKNPMFNRRGYKSPFYGRKWSQEVKEKIRESHKGIIPNDVTRQKMSDAHLGEKNHFFGKSHTIETKRKIREGKLKWIERTGIPSNMDEGSVEWFEKYNRETRSNFKPKRFLKIGYDADGYDEEKHIWIEYDTPYHNTPLQREKDLIRQKNIIEYFERIGNPLNQFVRVDATNPDRFGIEVVYRGRQLETESITI